MLGSQLQAGSIQDAITAIGEAFGNQLGKFASNTVALSRVPVLSRPHRDQVRQPFL
jgi:hypothetical protein